MFPKDFIIYLFLQCLCKHLLGSSPVKMYWRNIYILGVIKKYQHFFECLPDGLFCSNIMTDDVFESLMFLSAVVV